nr:hypothetical protein [Oligoflexales bacterium]
GGGPSFPVVSAPTPFFLVYQDQMASFHDPLFVGEFFVRGGTYFFRLGLFQSASGPLVSEIFEWRGEGTPCQPSTFWSSQIPARPWPIFMANLQPRFGQLEWIKSLFPGGNLCLVEKRNIFLRDQARPSSDHLARTVGDFFPKTSEPWTSTRSDLLFEGLRSHVLG